ncbi:Glutathione S-transferase, omega [gamma proteobacterium IMCC1989]|nr:Glutathione S-transferase, omega [gamma proteobacterium IMCC1989]
MGLLVKGEWHDQWYDTKSVGGEFIREDAQYRHWITADGQSGKTGDAGFTAETDRYHLYVSLACPWAHRTLIFRELKQLKNIISVSVVHPDMLDKGWSFAADFEDATGDTLYQSQHAYEIYTRDNPHYSGRVTVPILWDKKQQRIVNNESSDIIRMLNSAFNHLTNNHDDYYPDALQDEIDRINNTVYRNINNGVYRAGFATTPEAYKKSVITLFDTLDKMELILSEKRYLTGDSITEADWRLFTTLIRFDAVYVGHFKCNLKRIADYPNLSHYLRELYQYDHVKKTVNMTHIKRHYYYSHDMINPTRIVPEGPVLHLDEPHNRG